MKRKFWKDLFTGRDGRTYDIGRVLWFQSIQAFIGLTAYALYKGGEFDAVAWGAGLAGLLAAGGAALGLKAGAEPDLNGNGIPDYLENLDVERRKRSRKGSRREPRLMDEVPEVEDHPDGPSE